VDIIGLPLLTLTVRERAALLPYQLKRYADDHAELARLLQDQQGQEGAGSETRAAVLASMLPAIGAISAYVNEALGGADSMTSEAEAEAEAKSNADISRLPAAIKTLAALDVAELVIATPRLFVLSETFSYVAQLVNALLLLATFGAVCPLLACALLVALAAITLRWHALAASFLLDVHSLHQTAATLTTTTTTTTAGGGGGGGTITAEAAAVSCREELAVQLVWLQLLESDCGSLPKDLFSNSTWFVLQFMAVFFGLFVVDIVGDTTHELGSTPVVLAVVLMVSTPSLIRLAKWGAKAVRKPAPAAALAWAASKVQACCNPVSLAGEADGDDEPDPRLAKDLEMAAVRRVVVSPIQGPKRL